MSVKGILTVLDELREQGHSIRMVMSDGAEMTGVWRQAESPDWVCTEDRRFWVRMSTVDRFEVQPPPPATTTI